MSGDVRLGASFSPDPVKGILSFLSLCLFTLESSLSGEGCPDLLPLFLSGWRGLCGEVMDVQPLGCEEGAQAASNRLAVLNLGVASMIAGGLGQVPS